MDQLNSVLLFESKCTRMQSLLQMFIYFKGQRCPPLSKCFLTLCFQIKPLFKSASDSASARDSKRNYLIWDWKTKWWSDGAWIQVSTNEQTDHDKSRLRFVWLVSLDAFNVHSAPSQTFLCTELHHVLFSPEFNGIVIKNTTTQEEHYKIFFFKDSLP